jgi:phospholipase/carboxylesterase
MSWAVALGEGRPAPAGILANSGFIPEVEGWSADLESRRVQAYVHHGANDPVITVDFGRAARDRLLAAGLEPTYRETSAGHWLPPEAVAEGREFVATAIAAPQAP